MEKVVIRYFVSIETGKQETIGIVAVLLLRHSGQVSARGPVLGNLWSADTAYDFHLRRRVAHQPLCVDYPCFRRVPGVHRHQDLPFKGQ